LVRLRLQMELFFILVQVQESIDRLCHFNQEIKVLDLYNL
jgi:hypothetical protein